MEWEKLGCVYEPDGSLWWAKSHAMIPTPVMLNDSVIRVYITSCDKGGIGRVGYVDVVADEPTEIVKICKEPVLDVGRVGTFDENGAVVCSIVEKSDGVLYMFYAGFEMGTKIRYRIFTGLAFSGSRKKSFVRAKKVPILDRSDNELFFRCGPYARQTRTGFEMWYVAGSEWETVGDVEKPVYEIRYITSENGIDWPEQGCSCIQIERDNEHGFGRPYVANVNGKRLLFYSVRRRDLGSYRLGYAELSGENEWVRKDDDIGLDVSTEGWDSEMVCYSAVFSYEGRTYMFYNGNNFGQTGFGVAVLK